MSSGNGVGRRRATSRRRSTRRTSSSSASSTPRTSASRSASRSSAAARPGWRAPTGCSSCSPTTRRRWSGWARCRSRSSRRPRPAAATTCPGAVMRPGRAAGALPRHVAARTGARRASPSARSTRRPSTCSRPSRPSCAIPPPPPFKNHGNEVDLGRRAGALPAAQAEEAGAYILTETVGHPAARRGRARCVGVRSGDKGRGKDGEPLGNFEPGTDIKANATVLAEGCWGHLTGAAIREFDLGADREPQVWELGRQGGLEGPQAAGPPDPHDRARGR